MDAHQLTDSLPSVAKAVAALPLTQLVKRMLGPAADELADRWRGEVRLYRYGRQIACIKRAEEMAASAGLPPKAVPIKILFPLLEGASLEEDPNLQEMWAALLANSSTTMDSLIRPSFIRLLQDMAPDEARLLQAIADRDKEAATLRQTFVGERFNTLNELKAKEANVEQMVWQNYRRVEKEFPAFENEQAQDRESRFEACIQALMGARLVTQAGVPDSGVCFTLTERGRMLIRACTAPLSTV